MKINIKTLHKKSMIVLGFKPYNTVDGALEKRLLTTLGCIEGVTSVSSFIKEVDELHIEVEPSICDEIKNEIENLLLKTFNDRAVSFSY